MLCREQTLVKFGKDRSEAVPLKCRSWGCTECAPDRKRQLTALALAGRPTSFLTLTVKPREGQTPAERAVALAHAWRKLRRQAGDGISIRLWRWKQAAEQAAAEGRPLPPKPTKPDKATVAKLRVAFLAVVEKTKAGEPHLHILLRSHYLPQAWISERMAEMIGAPMVFITRVNNRAKTAAYVAKYMAKDPEAFKGCKRYWRSQDYAPTWTPSNAKDRPGHGEWTIMKMSPARVHQWLIHQSTTWETQGGLTVYYHKPRPPPAQAPAEAAPC